MGRKDVLKSETIVYWRSTKRVGLTVIIAKLDDRPLFIMPALRTPAVTYLSERRQDEEPSIPRQDLRGPTEQPHQHQPHLTRREWRPGSQTRPALVWRPKYQGISCIVYSNYWCASRLESRLVNDHLIEVSNRNQRPNQTGQIITGTVCLDNKTHVTFLPLFMLVLRRMTIYFVSMWLGS